MGARLKQGPDRQTLDPGATAGAPLPLPVEMEFWEEASLMGSMESGGLCS